MITLLAQLVDLLPHDAGCVCFGFSVVVVLVVLAALRFYPNKSERPSTKRGFDVIPSDDRREPPVSK